MHSNEAEFSFLIEKDVVIAEVVAGQEAHRQLVPLFLERLVVEFETRADFASLDEVHLKDFLTLIVDYILAGYV